MKKLLSVTLLACVAFISTAPIATQAEAARKTPAVRPAAYRNLNLAQQYSDAKDWEKALKELNNLKLGEARLNGYEKATMYNMLGFIYFSQQKMDDAITAYENVIADVSVIPEALENATIYGLAQLYFGNEQYGKAVEFMKKWEALTGKENLQAKLLIAQSYYQTKEYKLGIEPMQQAIDIAKADGKDKPEENWLLLLRVFYFESGDKKKATSVMEDLVELYPTKNYWMQLATIYGQRKMETKQLQAFDSMYRQNLLDKEFELINYAQLLLAKQVPYQAAKVLAKGIKDGVLEESLDNLDMMARAYSQAKEYEDAVASYKRANQFDDKGESLFSAARILVLEQNWEEVADVLSQAANKGGIKREDQMYLMLGMAQFNLKQFNEARVSFNKAKEDKRSDKTARQWISYVNSEQKRQEAIAEYL